MQAVEVVLLAAIGAGALAWFSLVVLGQVSAIKLDREARVLVSRMTEAVEADRRRAAAEPYDHA